MAYVDPGLSEGVSLGFTKKTQCFSIYLIKFLSVVMQCKYPIINII